MIPWPAKLLKRYPLIEPPPALLSRVRDVTLIQRNPNRPWWVMNSVGTAWLRQKTWAEPERPFHVSGINSDLPWLERHAHVNGDMIGLDASDPLPRPDFRVGQIWGDEHGGAILLHRTLDVELASDSVSWTNRYRFLVHDTVCPWLAPWSPWEKKS